MNCGQAVLLGFVFSESRSLERLAVVGVILLLLLVARIRRNAALLAAVILVALDFVV